MRQFLKDLKEGCGSTQTCILIYIVFLFALFMIVYDFPVFEKLLKLFPFSEFESVDQP